MKRLGRFAILSLLCIVALAVGMGFVLSSLLTRAVSDWEWENTAALVRREVRMGRLETVFTDPAGPQAERRLAELAALLTTLPEVVRVKVWDREARVLWSDERHLIGRRFPDNEELREALGGHIEVEIQRLDKREQAYERLVYATLAELYVPILAPADGRVLGVIEVYKTPGRLLATIRWGRTLIWSISIAGGLALYLVLLPLLKQVYRRQVEEETLRAYAGRLEAEVAQRTEQLIQAQKMEAVGLLAGGVAHDFNNLLTVILGRSQVVLGRLPADARVRADFDLIVKTAERAAALTRQLLAFSRKQVLQRRVIDLNALVGGIEPILRRLAGEHVTLVTRLDPDLGCVDADAAQLEQVLLNLAVNARDAMPNGGLLLLQSANVELDAAAAGRLGARAGAYVVLAVTDTGVGMDAATQARLFEPFFTTKEPGRGTGLGLATVYGIVQQHGGHVAVESAPGQGTTFRIYLPRGPAARPAAEPARPAPEEVAVRGGSETILVAEDEDGVRQFAAETLRERGYQVLEAADGRTALEMAEHHPGPIHLLLTDVVMPQLNGWELGRELAARRPQTKVLYMTGYTEITARHDGSIEPGEFLLQKPFTPLTLARRVRDVLDAPLARREP